MKPLAIALLASLALQSACAQANIRQVDFKNFAYPLKDHLLGHNELKWLTAQIGCKPILRTVQLRNGTDLDKTQIQAGGREYAQYEGFTLQEVSYAKLTGNSDEVAIVVLTYHTGGTQTTNYVYLYAFEAGKPKLLAYCHTGDRAYFGLHKVYDERGTLVFELFDPKKRQGDCCSSGIVRTRYRWAGGRFVHVGSSEELPLKEP